MTSWWRRVTLNRIQMNRIQTNSLCWIKCYSPALSDSYQSNCPTPTVPSGFTISDFFPDSFHLRSLIPDSISQFYLKLIPVLKLSVLEKYIPDSSTGEWSESEQTHSENPELSSRTPLASSQRCDAWFESKSSRLREVPTKTSRVSVRFCFLSICSLTSWKYEIKRMFRLMEMSALTMGTFLFSPPASLAFTLQWGHSVTSWSTTKARLAT